jgi:hypothetical protein
MSPAFQGCGRLWYDDRTIFSYMIAASKRGPALRKRCGLRVNIPPEDWRSTERRTPAYGDSALNYRLQSRTGKSPSIRPEADRVRAAAARASRAAVGPGGGGATKRLAIAQ